MSRRFIPSNSLEAAVRRYFGISQATLAQFLGISQGQLANVEAGRRTLGTAAMLRLVPLAKLVPEVLPATTGTEPELPLPVAPAPGPLEARRRFCVWRAVNLRYELLGLTQRAIQGQRWQLALPIVLAALPPAAPEAPDRPPPDASRATLAAWARFTYPRLLVQQWATAFTPDDAARYHLLRLQAEALETEAAALAVLLANAGDGEGTPVG
jgi:transcriptional regulator with XRE-family HTH domain